MSKYFQSSLEVLREQGPKMALNTCEKFIKKGYDNGALSALKAYILIQLGKENEGLLLANEVVKRVPTDLETLVQLEKVFIIINDYKAAAEMFEQAFNVSKREEIGIYWFLSVIRLEDPKKLFTIALSLRSLYPHSRYTFWAVVALYLHSANDKEAGDKESKLAQQIISKELEKQGNLNSVEELNLFLLVNILTNNHEGGLTALEKYGETLQNNLGVASVKADLLLKASHWDEAFNFCSSNILENGLNDWNIWKVFISAYDQKPHSDADSVLSSILNSDHKENDQRSLMLARIDACLHGYKIEGKTAASLLTEYADNFSRSPNRIPDIVHMIKKFSLQDTEEFQIIIIERISNGKDLIFWSQIKRIIMSIGKTWNLSEVELMIEALQDYESTEKDELVLQDYTLAILELDIYRFNSHNPINLFNALEHLKKALNRSPDDFIVRILFVIVALLSGAIFVALDAFRELDIKQIQIDSLAYILSDHLLNLGNMADADTFFHEAFFIYDDNRTQSISALSDLFLKNSYSRIPEFYELFTRLEHSIQSVSCILQTIRSEFLQMPLGKIKEYLEFMKTEELIFDVEMSKKISDNRDTDIVYYLDQSGAIKEEIYSLLPSFNKSSIWTYTCFTLILKSLLKSDSNQLSQLKATYLYPEYLRVDCSEIDQCRVVFVKDLVELLGEYKFDGENIQNIISGLRELVPTISNEDVKIKCYTSIQGLQWQAEQLRWLSICTSLFVCSHKGKVKKHVQKEVSSIYSSLSAALKTLKANLSSIEMHDFSEALSSETSQMIVDDWHRSVSNIIGILDLTQDLIKEEQN